MRKALENADLRKGLKFASEMLAQLKTSSLTPRNYYILFMTIFDYMRGNRIFIQNSKTILKRTSEEEEKWSMFTKQSNMLQVLFLDCIC